MEEDGSVDITEEFMEWLHEQPTERLAVAEARAEKLDYWDDESWAAALQEVLHEMYVNDCMSDLLQDGKVTVEVREDGLLAYTLTEDEELAA